ncbi:docking protein 3 [Alosa alosa]|nr:docking protein 3 [Alosa alosa]
MDVVEKEGLVMIQGMKFGKKFWKRTWMILFQPSSSGIGRIELYDVRDGPLSFSSSARPPGLKKMEKRAIRLSDCLSIVLAPEESCPTDFGAFDLNTAQRTYTIATPMVKDWLQTLCELAFPKNDGTSDARKTLKEDTSMAENELYSSWKSGQYQVKVQQTGAATRCCLAGSYALCPDTDSLSLLDLETSKTIYCWPYRLLRRFGTLKEGGVTIEAGRRSESGEGHFTFLSKQGPEIYRAMEEAIARQSGRLDPRPAPPPEPVALPVIPKPPSFRGSMAPAALSRWNISLPELPARPQPPPASSHKDLFSVIEMQPKPRAQPKLPKMPLSMLPSLPSSDSRDESEEEKYSSIGNDSGHHPNDDSLVYSKLSGLEDSYEEAPSSQEQDCVYSRVADHPPPPPLPPPPAQRRTLVRTLEERVVEEEEEGEEEGERARSVEEGGAHVITTTSEIPVNFKQTLANILFKDLAKFQIQPTLPTERTDSDGTFYPKNFDM